MGDGLWWFLPSQLSDGLAAVVAALLGAHKVSLVRVLMVEVVGEQMGLHLGRRLSDVEAVFVLTDEFSDRFACHVDLGVLG